MANSADNISRLPPNFATQYSSNIKPEEKQEKSVAPANDASKAQDTTTDPAKSSDIIWRFVQFQMKAMAEMQDDIFGPVDPATGTRSKGLMGTVNDQNKQLSEINNYLTQATAAQQKDKDNQTISDDMVEYLASQSTTNSETGKAENPLKLEKNKDGYWENSYIKWKKGKDGQPGHYEVKDKKQWQTITTQLNGDSNTIRNDSQTTTIKINAQLTQFQNIQQSMQQAIQGIAGALNQLIQGAGR